MSHPSTAPDSGENLETHDEDSNVFKRDDAISDRESDSKVHRILQEVVPQNASNAGKIRTSADSDLLPSERKKAVRDKMNQALKDALPDFDL